MATNAEICKHARAWLQGEICLRQFEDWFVPATWRSYQNTDLSIHELVDEIELNLSEYSDGLINDQQLRQRLSNLDKGTHL